MFTDGVIALSIFTIGTAIGSFIYVVVGRFQKSERLTGRSHCPHCQHTLAWWEIIPLFSFVALRGRCHHCHAVFSVQYPLTEVLVGILFLIVFLPLPLSLGQWLTQTLTALSMCLLVILLLIDLHTFLLPDKYIACLTGVVLLVAVMSPGFTQTLVPSLLGMAIGAGFLGVLWLVTRGQGLGLGDVKLMLPIGFLFGWDGTLVLLWLAFVLGGCVGAWLLFMKRVKLKTAIPFGPFLAGTALLLLVYPTLVDHLFALLLG